MTRPGVSRLRRNDHVLGPCLTSRVVVEQVPEEALRCLEEIARQTIVLRLAIVDLANDAVVEAQHRRSRKRQQERRMRRDDELRHAWRGELVEDAKKRELALR